MAAELNPPLIVILGPTASGKSKLALELAKRYNGELICADSRTVYKGMDIGTAKPSHVEQAVVPHHLIDVINPDQPFNAAIFKQMAEALITDIAARGKTPIMVGGTGLYIDSVLFGLDFKADSAEKDSLNPRHQRDSGFPASGKSLRPNTLVIGIDVPKDELNERIEKRVKDMVKAGLETEVRDLARHYGWDAEAMTGVGYREWKQYFEGKQTLEETIMLISTHTRQYAKRQRTWFKRNEHIKWITPLDNVYQIVKSFLQQKGEAITE